MTVDDLRELLLELRWENPGAHAHTLACEAMARWGVDVCGARVKELLREGKGVRRGDGAGV
jgi:hypothetical protein